MPQERCAAVHLRQARLRANVKTNLRREVAADAAAVEAMAEATAEEMAVVAAAEVAAARLPLHKLARHLLPRHRPEGAVQAHPLALKLEVRVEVAVVAAQPCRDCRSSSLHMTALLPMT